MLDELPLEKVDARELEQLVRSEGLFLAFETKDLVLTSFRRL
jgi:hypothetical protein